VVMLVPDQLCSLRGELSVGAAEYELTVKIPLKNLRYCFIPVFLPNMLGCSFWFLVHPSIHFTTTTTIFAGF
jgi:hypothetical protein